VNRRDIVWFACFSAIGVLYQSISLAAFIFVARTDFAYVGKRLVVGAAILTTALMVWIWIRSMQETRWLILAPASLAVGYSLAFHLVGVMFFPGLLAISIRHSLITLWQCLRVTGSVFVIFALVPRSWASSTVRS